MTIQEIEERKKELAGAIQDVKTNEELEELDSKAKKVKIQHGASATEKTEKKEKKPRTVKISDEKQGLFDNIYHFLVETYGGSVDILKENKLLTLKIGEKTFKVDLIEQRAKKGADMQKINADYEIQNLKMQVETLKKLK